MGNQILFISIMVASAIFLLIVAGAVVQYQKTLKKSIAGKKNPDEWLFHKFYKKVYSALFGNRNADEAALKLGIKLEEYYKNCALTKTKPNVELLVTHTLYGVAILFLCVFLTFVVHPIFFFIGFLAFFLLAVKDQEKIKRKAKEMRLQVGNELPRYLDLLQTELEIGLPIESAIYILSERFQCLLSKEFLEALNEMELGLSGWQQALEKVAEKYDVETLSDFVLDVSTSYSKGVSIADTVTRKTKEVKETHLLNVKERAGKTANIIILPIGLFQFVPMMAFLMVPVMAQILTVY